MWCLFGGCVNNPATDKFRQDHNGLSTVIYCKDGFLLKEYIMQGDIFQSTIDNDAGYPTRCTADTSVTVKETQKTGLLVGGTQ